MIKNKENFFEHYDAFTSETYGDHKIRIVFTDKLKVCVKDILDRNKIVDQKKYIVFDNNTAAVCEDIQEETFTGILMIFNINQVKDRIIVHECFHAVYHLLDSLGVKLKPSSEESFAYFLDALFAKTIFVKKEANVEYKKYKINLKNEHNPKI